MSAFVVRAAMAVVIVLNIAVVAVLLESKETKLRYALVKKQAAAAKLVEENYALKLGVAQAKRGDVVLKKAAQFGVELKPVEGPVAKKSEEGRAKRETLSPPR